MFYTNKEEVEYFIHKVFNFYNGKINICNPAAIYIEWADLLNSSNGGTTVNPNVIAIYPCVIEKFSNNRFHFFYLILETIIHELFHVDQIIDYIRMTYDDEYVKYIEYAVETQTALYMADHKQEICQEFGIDIQADQDFYKNLINRYSMGNTYHRKEYTSHLLCILKEILSCSRLFNLDYLFESIKHNLNTLTGTICIVINDARFVIQVDNKIATIEDVNSFFYNNYFYGNYRDYSSAKYDVTLTNDKSINISIEVKAVIKNIMCKAYVDPLSTSI